MFPFDIGVFKKKQNKEMGQRKKKKSPGNFLLFSLLFLFLYKHERKVDGL